ncbi:hypothetical protein ABPG75_000950 [Micractinium tetrahymenae]
MKRIARALKNKEVAPAFSSGTSEVALSDGSMTSIDTAEDAECRAAWGVSLEQEWQLVEQLREEVELEAGELPVEWDDHVLRRFLRARKHNIYKAKVMILDTLNWRKEANVDTVLTDFHFHEKDQFNKWYPEGFYGVDREGRPIYVQQPGKMDTDQLWKFTTLERCVRYHLQQQERYWRIIAPAASVARGRRHEQSLVLIDMDGVGISTLTSEVRNIMGTIMKIDQDYYPELMWKACLVNVPVSFRVIWSMVKHFMDARTQAKIEVLGTNFQEELQRLVAPENLMACYGGTSTAPLGVQPGPWQDPAILAKLAEQRQQRQQESGRPASMTYPPVSQAAGAEGQDDAAAAAAAAGAAAASALQGSPAVEAAALAS